MVAVHPGGVTVGSLYVIMYCFQDCKRTFAHGPNVISESVRRPLAERRAAVTAPCFGFCPTHSEPSAVIVNAGNAAMVGKDASCRFLASSSLHP